MDKTWEMNPAVCYFSGGTRWGTPIENVNTHLLMGGKLRV